MLGSLGSSWLITHGHQKPIDQYGIFYLDCPIHALEHKVLLNFLALNKLMSNQYIIPSIFTYKRLFVNYSHAWYITKISWPS